MTKLSENDALSIYNEIREKTALPVFRGSFDEEKVPGLFDSKLGGVPYWDLTKPYPTGTDGQKLPLLAQIDLAALPGQGELPREGLLQVFVADEDVYGCDFTEPEPGVQANYRVVWHQTVDRSVTEESVLALEIPTSLTAELFPVEGVIAIRFDAPTREAMTAEDCRIDAAIEESAAALGIELPEDFSAFDLIDNLPKEVWEEWFQTSQGLKLLGYPFFTQYDPRNEDSRFDRLLLQIDSKGKVLWGDCGVGNFFINSEALKRWDLSDVLYNWDCG